MKKYLVLLLILMLTIIPAISAADNNIALSEGTTAKDGTQITLNNGDVSFSALNLSASTTTLINGQPFTPATTQQSGDSLVWGTGEKAWFIFDDPTTKISYQYSGRQLKETIVIKEDKQFSYDLNLNPNSKLIPWDNGQWKIVSKTSGNTMTGIILEKPYGIDANNRRIEMEYTYDGNNLNLVYNRTITIYQPTTITISEAVIASNGSVIPTHTQTVITPVYSQIAYPLTIDPTWTYSTDHWEATVGSDTVLMYNVTGTTTWTPPAGVTSIQYLAVGGGGGGAGTHTASVSGGGGGAGGFSNGTTLSVSSSNTETIVVGAGGNGGTSATTTSVGTSGSPSSIKQIASHSDIISGGGGWGSQYNADTSKSPKAGDGSSGGGAAYRADVPGYGVALGNGTGYRGGDKSNNDGIVSGGGGGGAAAQGGDISSSNTGGNGGNGLSSDITGSTIFYSGGGGGGGISSSNGGTAGNGGGGKGGGTDGANTAGTNGLGGGGGGHDSTLGSGGAGGSGVVIIRYTTPVPLVASFTSINISVATNSTARGWEGFAPFIMQFTNTSNNPPYISYVWNATPSQSPNKPITINQTAYYNPIYTFNSAGNYSINLNITNSWGTNISTQTTWVNITDYRINIPDFSATPVLASNYGMLVQFANTTTYSIPSTSVLWNFGDGYTSTSWNPSHYYSVANSSNVTATFTNATGTTVVTKLNYINLSSDLPNVVSWLHMDGANGGTTFRGEEGIAWTPSGGVTTQTGNKRFGNASALFNADNSRLQTPSNAVFNFGTGDATYFEGQVYPTASKNNVFIISRTSNAATRADGWGLYHSTASAASDGWVFYAGAAQTGTFTIPLNQFSHIAAQRISGVIIVSVAGVQVATVAAAGNYDTTNPVVYGQPTTGAGTASARMYLDETRISNNKRWSNLPFSTPLTPYAGDLFTSTIDPNPSSTLRFKTNPEVPSAAIMYNLTPRNRTVQIQYVPIANNISTVVIFNPMHVQATAVYVNSSMFTGINITKAVIDNAVGTVLINATRPGGFSTNGLAEQRGSFADIRMVYVNYTDPSEAEDASIQFFGSGFLGNLSYLTQFPVHNFIATNVSYAPWITYSNFTANPTSPVTGETAVFFSLENNQTTTETLWDWGDGSPVFDSFNLSEYHIYPASSGVTPKTVTATARLAVNNSVMNTTTRVGYITPVYNASYVKADFSATPLIGSPGVAVSFTDLSAWGSTNAVSGRTYNWSFGDIYSSTPYSNTKGSTTHVYPSAGTYTVNLTINNTISYDHEEKQNYITVSTNQQTSNVIWQPRSVAIQILDANHNPIIGDPVNITAYSSSLPGGLSGAVSYFRSTYGVTDVTATAMFAANTSYAGTTDDYGFIAIQAVDTIQYRVATQDTNGIPVIRLFWPAGSYYQIVTENASIYGIAAQGKAQASINANSTFKTVFWEPNTTHSCMGINVYDSTGRTSDIYAWWKLIDNGTVWWTNTTAIGGFGPVNSTMCVLHVPYQQWKWGGITD